MSRSLRGGTAGRKYTFLVWAALACVVATPVVIAAMSPLISARSGPYVMAGIAGAVALALLLVQPLLAAGYLPGLHISRARVWHRWLGSVVVTGVALHIGGLYLTSPPDTIDALLLVSPTPFSVYGVIGMWGVVGTAILVFVRTRMGYSAWRIVHNCLAAIVVVASVVHALMIEGTMGSISKLILSICLLAATAIVILHLRVVRPILRSRRSRGLSGSSR